jgi:hypothetical protein
VGDPVDQDGDERCSFASVAVVSQIVSALSRLFPVNLVPEGLFGGRRVTSTEAVRGDRATRLSKKGENLSCDSLGSIPLSLYSVKSLEDQFLHICKKWRSGHMKFPGSLPGNRNEW